jgi:hydrogenase nickel incorporation protein HypA/HybF
MHEVAALTRALIEAVATAERAGGRRIERLTFALAPGGHVTPENVKTLVPVLAAGTLAEGAAIVVEHGTASLQCLSCGRIYESAAADGACPACGGTGLATGELAEIALVSIDVVD